jgi:flavin reductase (DIM6/NTAB) family NADH-FMN oxidoreductase RutF
MILPAFVLIAALSLLPCSAGFVARAETPCIPADESSGAANHTGAAEDSLQSLGAGTYMLPVPVWVIGSYDRKGKPNMMTASWVGICCSEPPCVTISLRKATYTFGNIMERKAFTVNIPRAEHAAAVAFFGRVSGRDTDKLAATGLTPVRSALVDAPYLAEFPLVAECKVTHTYEAGLHTMFIGEIIDVKVDRSILGENARPDAGKIDPLLYAPGSSRFYGLGESIGRIEELANKHK